MAITIKLFLALIMLSFISCSPKEAISPLQLESGKAQLSGEVKLTGEETWEKKWERTLREAQKEGKVIVSAGGAAPPLIEATPLFKQRYGIDIEIMIGRGADTTVKLLTERRNGLFVLDIMIGGLNTAYGVIKPAGALDPLEPSLILPEVTDPALWYDSKLPWGDKDKYVFKPVLYRSTPIAINTELIERSQIKSYYDLLEPRWKGKITVNDPSIAGPGFNAFSTLLFNKVLDVDFFRQLIKQQEPVVMRDQRLQADWLAKGKYPLALWAHSSRTKEFMDAGAPIDWVMPKEGTYLSTTGAVTLVNRAPHPNASKIFVNWYLSKEGQIINQKFTGRQSSRSDISAEGVDLHSMRKPGEKYFPGANEIEEWVLHEQDKYLDLARNLFGPITGR